jgi:putative iron-regulated protein
MYRPILLLAGLLAAGQSPAAIDEREVISHYADLAEAKYADSLTAARGLQRVVDTLVATPSPTTLEAARAAWKAARAPYQQTEVFRFGNPVVDAWEGKVNAWPLDEGLIDYVEMGRIGGNPDENPLFEANVIANPRLTIAGHEIDASVIDRALIVEVLHEADGVETNVARGFHAVEFLLWGQDLNGTGPGAGQRPATDFDPENCTGGHCERRAAYLKAATDLLVDDLAWMLEQWGQGGDARRALLETSPRDGLAAILTGMGSLSYGELAGERMKLGLLLHDPEEEPDCFSDNTHNAHFNDVVGIRDIYLGRHTGPDGRALSGPALSDLVAASDPAADRLLRGRLDDTLARMQVLVDSAERDGVAYDQLIAAGNADGNAKVQAAIDALVAQTRAIEGAIAALGLSNVTLEGSDSLGEPAKLGQ